MTGGQKTTAGKKYVLIGFFFLILAAFLPDRQYIALMRYERYGILVLLVLSFAGIGSSLISRGILGVYSALLTFFFG